MKKTNPLLSVIVANYNNAHYLKDCLDSILKQTFNDFEIIVYDDCSSDNSAEIIEGYEKKNPGVVKGYFSFENKGVAMTRHESILFARGEYITTLDSDDYYYDYNKLELEMRMVFQYKKEKGKDILAFSNIVLIREDDSLIGFWGNPESIKEGMIFNEIISRSCFIPRDFIVKKEAYHNVGGYDSRFPIYEDWDLKIRLAKLYEFYYTGVNGTAYRQHEQGLSSIPFWEKISWMKKVFKKNFVLIDEFHKWEVVENFRQCMNDIQNRNKKRKNG